MVLTGDSKLGLGIIFPPSDIRGIIDKTAAFVAKNGLEFEQRVLKEQNNQRFSFLQADNPYRLYYEAKMNEFRNGETVVKPAVPEAIREIRALEDRKKKPNRLMITEDQNVDTEPLAPPEPEQYFIRHPAIADIDSDTIKLTAQFVARNGQKFLSGLMQRERNNPQFEFLKPSSNLFGYFTDLVECYTKAILPDTKYIDKLKDYVTEGRAKVLRSCNRIYLWNRKRNQELKDKAQSIEDERQQMLSINWHDFVVVETITFTDEDEAIALNEPIDLTVLSETQKYAPLNRYNISHINSRYLDETDSMEIEEIETPSVTAKPLEMPPMPPEDKEIVKRPVLVEADESDHMIRHDYVRSKRAHSTVYSTPMQKCPITGVLVPQAQMTQHLKVLIMDPKWKIQKDKLLEKASKESAFAPERDVEANLAQFVAKRPDLFGSVEDEIQERTFEAAQDIPQ